MHNPYNLKVNDIVILDEEYNNSSRVIIKNITANQMFATIEDREYPHLTWEVMTNRLTPIKS